MLMKLQVHKASQALLKHIRDRKQQTGSKNLLEAGNENTASTAVPIWLVFNTKKHITNQNRLKPGKIPIPHSLNRPEASICLITADPQRAFKDLIEEETFPAALRSQIRILGLEKVKQRYKSFEQQRQLVAEYDVFLATPHALLLSHLEVRMPVCVRVCVHVLYCMCIHDLCGFCVLTGTCLHDQSSLATATLDMIYTALMSYFTRSSTRVKLSM